MVNRLSSRSYRTGCVLAAWFLLLASISSSTSKASELTPEQIEFFESKVRPILAGNCYSCHSSRIQTPFANLRLDSRVGILKGGDSGPAVVPGNPSASRLVQTIRYASTLKMPPTGKLAESKIEALVAWIEMEAPWPEEVSPEASKTAEKFDLGARKREHWAWQSIREVVPPAIDGVEHPVDRFLLAALRENQLRPAATADHLTLLRRVYFDLTGLPPSPEEIQRFFEDREPNAYERLVDRLLESPRFGEHWARRWMDWVRYAESHGSEGDPDVPQAWRYRDYVIRAINNDVPYDQLIREYLAGDLLPTPRINESDGINESMLGTAHFRMVEHGFQPVDPLEDRVNWTENQVDVFSKAFQGLTVACARCHDHKFDAISQKDFYAVFGSLRGARPIQTVIDSPERVDTNRSELADLKRKVRTMLATAWLRQANKLVDHLIEAKPGAPFLERSACDKERALYPWVVLASKQGDEFTATWRGMADEARMSAEKNLSSNKGMVTGGWNLRGKDYTQWLKHGIGLPKASAIPGEFWIMTEGDRVISGVYPAGVYSHGLSRKHSGVLQSPRFRVESNSISLRLLGGNFSSARLVVENYVLGRGSIYRQHFNPKRDRMTWVTWDTEFWKGFDAYIEIATLDDTPHFRLDRAFQGRSSKPKPKRDGRSFFGLTEVVFHDDKEPPKPVLSPVLHALQGSPPVDTAALAAHYQSLLIAAIEAWRDDDLSDGQAVFLDDFVRVGFLETSMQRLDDVKPLVARFRQLEEEIPVPRRAPGVLAEVLPPQRLLIRGSHKNLGVPVPERYLEALGSSPYEDSRTARLRLAGEVTDLDNPLTARVIVNRLWYYIFGRGIVSTVDNFGKLGERPTHPELLDYLASRFMQGGLSIKSMVRFLVTTEAYRRSSEVSAEAAEKDPLNALLQHMPLRRLEAEAIRDAVLAVSGQLDYEMFGESIKTYYAKPATDKKQAKGGKTLGPMDGARRRSIYLEVRRNVSNPFLEVFDAPKPATARGMRDVTNVPAQSLTMMNSPFIILESEKWAETLVTDGKADLHERIGEMFVRALGRRPSPAEMDQSQTFLATVAEEYDVGSEGILSSRSVWQDFAQAIFNLKEFLYIR